MRYRVNGEQREIGGEVITINEVLTKERVQNPDMVAVQFNGEFLNKTFFDSTTVKDSDEIEFVYFMGGG
ncbi:MAG: sulfur carrier protein ThiS [Dissulfurispiraceae bacterium]